MLGAVLSVAFLGALPPSPPVAHPIHTAFTEISYDGATHDALIRIRLFADDIAGAIPGLRGLVAADSALSRYGRGAFALTASSGQPVLLRWDGVEWTGDTVVLAFRGAVPDGLAGSRVMSAMLWERFRDQINIVRASHNGRVTTLLFTRGDSAKTIC